MLPSRGNCHAVFLLTRAAHLKRPTSFDSWVVCACGLSTIMATALDLKSAAGVLVGGGLFRIEETISVAKALDRLWAEANRPTMLGIARVLFQTYPPSWLANVVSETAVATEYIPADDLRALEWLGSDLELLLMEIGWKIIQETDADLRKRLGDAGERVVLAAKEAEGGSVIHVASISDFYGYDVESHIGGRTQRIEVKAAVPHTAESFVVSRNEYEKSVIYGDEWFLMQIVFDSSVLVKSVITSVDILSARILPAGSLRKLVNVDTQYFTWAEAAKISPPPLAWVDYALPFSQGTEVDLDHIPLGR